MFMRTAAVIAVTVFTCSLAEASSPSFCIGKAQFHGGFMQDRKEGKSLARVLQELDSEVNTSPNEVDEKTWRDMKNTLKHLAINIYSLPYQDPDKFTTAVFNSCMKEAAK